MVLKYNFKGLMAPVFTAFQNSQSMKLNLDVIPKYIQHLKLKDVKGVLVNGTTGEHILMSLDERKAVAEAWAKAAKEHNLNLMVQVGGAPLPDVLELARHAESLKVDGILCLPELFFRPKTIQELISYLKAVSSAAPKTPLFYYHIPSFTGVNLAMDEFLRLGKEDIPTLSGIKFTSNDMDEGVRCLNIDKNFSIFLGADKIYSGALVLGFDSAIMTTINFWPECFQSITRFISEGNVQEARAIQNVINEKIDKILQGGNWVSKMKFHMNNNVGINVGLSRLSVIQ